MKTLVLVLALSSLTLSASEPAPKSQPPTRGLLGSGPVVTVRQRTLAEVAKEKPTKPGTVSQMEGGATPYQAPQLQLLSTTTGQTQPRGGENITFNAPPAQGTTHAPPVVGMSVEQQRGEKR